VTHARVDLGTRRQRCVQERMRTLYRLQRQKLKKNTVASEKTTEQGSSSSSAEAAAAGTQLSAADDRLLAQHPQQASAAAAASLVAQESQGWLTTIMSRLQQSISGGTDAAAAAVDPGVTNPEWSDQFTTQVQARLGAVVLAILLRSCTIEAMVASTTDGGAGLPGHVVSEELKPMPAFYHAYLHSKMKRIGVIKAADAVFHHIEMAGEYVESMHPRHQPMVARPLPWTAAEQVIGRCVMLDV